ILLHTCEGCSSRVYPSRHVPCCSSDTSPEVDPMPLEPSSAVPFEGSSIPVRATRLQSVGEQQTALAMATLLHWALPEPTPAVPPESLQTAELDPLPNSGAQFPTCSEAYHPARRGLQTSTRRPRSFPTTYGTPVPPCSPSAAALVDADADTPTGYH